MSEELKPCPFCGGEVELSYAGGDHIVLCACGINVELPAITDSRDFDDKMNAAVSEWNTRAPAWQDISTAPKHAYVWHRGRLVLVHWCPSGLYGEEKWVDRVIGIVLHPQPTQHLVFEPPQTGEE